MFTRFIVFAVSLMMLAFVAGGCSSTGGSQAAPSSARSESAAPSVPQYEVTARSLNVRQAPSVSATVVGSLKQGEHVAASQPAEDGWLRVEGVNGLTGYASAKYLRALATPAAAPTQARTQPAPAPAPKQEEAAPSQEAQGRPAPAGTALARVKLGMSEPEVAAILGVPTNQSNYQTGKAWIPYYYGSDTSRLDYKYKGVGVVVFGRNRYSGQTKVIRIDYDPNEDGL